MKDRLDCAKNALQGDVTFAAILADGSLITSEKKGIAPIMALLQENVNSLRDACVADRVIGRAAALLMERAGVAAAYGEVVSSHALRVFEKSNIRFYYNRQVEYIINRAKTGMCPMEQTVLRIENPEEAYCALQKKMQELSM